jgi:PAS domain S-box-containing protein
MMRLAQASRLSAQSSLATVASLKTSEIAAWYAERRTDARLIMRNPIIERLATRALAGSAAPSDSRDLRFWMRNLRTLYRYRRVVLYDAHGRALIVEPEDRPDLEPQDEVQFRAALHGTDVSIGDLIVDGDAVELPVWIPVREDASAAASGALLLDVDPSVFLYPLIQTWPADSASAETLLVRREGDTVLYLNPLRFNPDAAMTLRLPLAVNLPAAQAVMGRKAVVEGRDYRGVDVLAALQSVNGTPWFVVAKIDRAEVYAPLRERSLLTAAVFLLFFVAAGLGIQQLWRKRNRTLVERQLLLARERAQLAERIVHINRFANDIILLLDKDWRILEANERAVQAYGYTQAELMTMNLSDLRVPSERARFRDIENTTRLNDGVISETQHQRKSGRVFPVETSVRATEVGGARYYQAIIRDISERRRAEDTIRHNEHLLRLFVEHAPAAIAMLDTEMRYLVVSRRYVIDNRITEESFIGKSHYEVLPDVPERWKAVHRRCLAGAVEKSDEDVFPRADGQTDWLRWEIRPWRTAAGEIGGIIIFSELITEEHLAKEGMRQSEEKLRAYFDSGIVGNFLGDTDGRICDANDEFLRIVGYSREDLGAGLVSSSTLTPPEFQALDDAAIRQAQARGSCAPYEKQYIRKDGSRAWVLVGFVLLGERRDQSVALVLDLTERKRAEEDIHRLNIDLDHRVHVRTAELEASNRELEAFSYSVSHDLRSPLRGIDGWSLALLEDYGATLDETARGYLNRVRSETQRMGVLIDDLLQLSRVTRAGMRRAPVDLSAIAGRIVERLRESGKDRAVDVSIPPGVTAWGDETLLEVVLSNLIENAFKFTAPRDGARIEFGCVAREGEKIYFVRDNGVGFDPAFAGKLFTPFQRMHRSSDFPGTGIGLATVQRVVSRHGGRVWADAAVDAGATFSFTLSEAP